jgi:hypothetical protein
VEEFHGFAQEDQQQESSLRQRQGRQGRHRPSDAAAGKPCPERVQSCESQQAQ